MKLTNPGSLISDPIELSGHFAKMHTRIQIHLEREAALARALNSLLGVIERHLDPNFLPPISIQTINQAKGLLDERLQARR